MSFCFQLKFFVVFSHIFICSSIFSAVSFPPVAEIESAGHLLTASIPIEGVFEERPPSPDLEVATTSLLGNHALLENSATRSLESVISRQHSLSAGHDVLANEDREPFSLPNQTHNAGSAVAQLPVFSESSDSHSGIMSGRLNARRTHQPVDKEAAEVPDMAHYNPNDFVRGFKKGMISVGDKASLACKILEAGCSIMLAIGVGDYMVGGSFLSDDFQSKISILSAAGVAVFKTLGELLEKIKLRDECRLISYDSRDKFLAMRNTEYPNVYYSINEITDYLRQNNDFVTLPRASSFATRLFLFNVMCFFESVLGMCWAVTAGLSGISTISGLSDKNLINLSDMGTYRTLTIVFTATTAIIVLLDKNRQQLKTNCENWILNYEMLIRYFISHGVSAEELSRDVKPVPPFFINADLHEAMQQA